MMMLAVLCIVCGHLVKMLLTLLFRAVVREVYAVYVNYFLALDMKGKTRVCCFKGSGITYRITERVSGVVELDVRHADQPLTPQFPSPVYILPAHLDR